MTSTYAARPVTDSQPDCTALRLAEIAEASSSGQRPRRASTQLLACAESALAPLLRALGGDLLHAVLKLLGDADLPCARLACKAFCDHSSPAQEKCRVDFLRTHTLAVFACERMPGFLPEATPSGAESDDDDDSEDDEPTALLSLAASIGVVGVLEELVDNRQCELTTDACAAAAGRENLDALVWLRNRGCPWDITTCHCAAKGGHFEVLRYAHEHGCTWDSATCHRAAQDGHLEVLRFAHEHGCPCIYAALGGHLAVLRYAHEHGCPWNSNTRYYAARKGHLEVLRYAHEHSCPWDFDHCSAVALSNGHAAVVE
ncbi:hypothetical protein T492DRAFT_884367 [Pavlovales sp. CCMP2436]|nr:hypothetical protein T492DRAFT_884367 [Pavlovales sp. CCMP2436]